MASENWPNGPFKNSDGDVGGDDETDPFGREVLPMQDTWSNNVWITLYMGQSDSNVKHRFENRQLMAERPLNYLAPAQQKQAFRSALA